MLGNGDRRGIDNHLTATSLSRQYRPLSHTAQALSAHSKTGINRFPYIAFLRTHHILNDVFVQVWKHALECSARCQH